MKVIITILSLLTVLANQYRLQYLPLSKTKQSAGEFDNAIVTKTNK